MRKRYHHRCTLHDGQLRQQRGDYHTGNSQKGADELGGKTILGVSNISFGLPQREIVNAAFFTMALQNGLNAAIINPNSEAMMRSYYSFRVLADLDPQCSEYIRVYSGQVATL